MCREFSISISISSRLLSSNFIIIIIIIVIIVIIIIVIIVIVIIIIINPCLADGKHHFFHQRAFHRFLLQIHLLTLRINYHVLFDLINAMDQISLFYYFIVLLFYCFIASPLHRFIVSSVLQFFIST
jgi:hypothetical protein